MEWKLFIWARNRDEEAIQTSRPATGAVGFKFSSFLLSFGVRRRTCCSKHLHIFLFGGCLHFQCSACSPNHPIHGCCHSRAAQLWPAHGLGEWQHLYRPQCPATFCSGSYQRTEDRQMHRWRTIESFDLKGTLHGHLVQHPAMKRHIYS